MDPIDFTQLLLPQYSMASITTWNRLNSYPRTADFGRSLKADVRDAMWMLTRQWQFGEFSGEDAGSPVSIKVAGLHQTPNTLSVRNGQPVAYDSSTPLEAMVEQEVIQPTLRLRVQMGRMVDKFLRIALPETDANAVWQFFIMQFVIPDFSVNDNEATRQFFSVVSGRVADGYAIYQKASANRSTFFATLPTGSISSEVQNIVEQTVLSQVISWFDRLYAQPKAGQSAWQPDRMEYVAKLNVPGQPHQQVSLTASDYAGGRLDWTAFNIDQQLGPVLTPSSWQPLGTPVSAVFLPTNVTFKGMPQPRFWQLEPGTIDFGKVENSPAGLVGLLLAEYGLTYSNDWFMIPYPLKINTLCIIQGLVVTDVFGQKSFVAPSRTNPDTNWQQLALFNSTTNIAQSGWKSAYYLPPVVGAMQQSNPLERVCFMRDEMANMVWAIEDIVPMHTGGGAKTPQIRPVQPSTENPTSNTWQYTLGTTVPDHWVPFIAVHKQNSVTEVQLQRGRLPNTPSPESVLLTENQPVYFIQEEEIPRAGVVVDRSLQRVRWLNGRTYLWVGRRKQTGRGEGNSGLLFDKAK